MCASDVDFPHTQTAMSQVEVRPIQAAELDELLPLIAGYQKFYGAEADYDRNRRFFSRFLHPSDEGLLLGAWMDGRLTGFATLYWFFSSTKATDSVLMNDLFVSEDVRGAGIGRALIAPGVVHSTRQRDCSALVRLRPRRRPFDLVRLRGRSLGRRPICNAPAQIT